MKNFTIFELQIMKCVSCIMSVCCVHKILYQNIPDAVPQILYSFSNQTLIPGPPISLKCIAKGIPPPNFDWSLDGFPIPINER